MPGVVCAGNIVVDVLARAVGTSIQWNTTTWIDDVEQSLGGNGANTAFAIGMLEVAARLVGATGEDAFGEYARSRLREARVDLSYVERVGFPTAAASVLVRADGARAFLHRRGASRVALAEPIDFRKHASDGFAHFHVGNLFALANLRERTADHLKAARAAAFTTSLDTGHDALGEWMTVLEPSLAYLDLLFVNEDEARTLTGQSEAEEAARVFLGHGVGTVVLKRGERGCAVLNGNVLARFPAYDVPVVDTTGAGDCFAGGYLAAMALGKAVEECAGWANACGALNVQAIGGTTGLRGRAEMLEWMAEARPKPTS